MIVIDTSALMAMALGEPPAGKIRAAINDGGQLLISAGTLAETHIVARRRGIGDLVHGLIEALGMEVVPVTQGAAQLVADAYDRWGKGVHPASLGFGDCFAYALAIEKACPLLFVGNDFSQTDVGSALA